jgi:DNA-binding PadR family transcriptional regulator
MQHQIGMSPRLKSPFELEYALLGLFRHGPQHAYEIHQQLATTEVLSLIWRLKQRQVYALLERLEEEGYLFGTTAAQEHRPPRHMLQLTAAGQAAFDEWLATPVKHGRDFRQHFMAKLFFARQEDDAVVALLIARQRTLYQRQIDSFKQQLATTPSMRELDMLVYQFRIRQLEMILGWLETCSATLLASAPTITR